MSFARPFRQLKEVWLLISAFIFGMCAWDRAKGPSPRPSAREKTAGLVNGIVHVCLLKPTALPYDNTLPILLKNPMWSKTNT